MVHKISDLIVSFILLGFIEAVVKPAATYWVRRKLIKWSPFVLSYVDNIFPTLILNDSSKDLDKLVRTKFSELTGEDWSAVNLDYFWSLYDPRITLKKSINIENLS